MAYVLPSYVKPRSKILSWLIAMALHEGDNTEYILDNAITRITIRENVEYAKAVRKTALDAIAKEVVMRYKVTIEDSAFMLVPLEYFVKNVVERTIKGTQMNPELAKLNGEFCMHDSSALDLIQTIVSGIDRDALPQIAVPMQWLVYVPRQKMLTRMCFVRTIRGNVVVRPFTPRNLLLEVDGEIEIESPETMSLEKFKRAILIKEKVNDEWRRLVAETALEEAFEEISVGPTAKPITEQIRETKTEGKIQTGQGTTQVEVEE